MGLVDYASSGEESEGETKVENEKEVIKQEKKPLTTAKTVPIINSREEDDNTALFKKLPKPRKEFTFLGDDSNLSKLLLNKSNLRVDGKTDNKSIKIAAPSVSEFNEEQPRKKLKPSVKGVGLFSILPPPKNNTIKESNKTLIPQILAKSQSKKNEILKKKTNVNTGGDPDDDDIQIGSSFFGSSLTELSSKVDTGVESVSNVNYENTAVANWQNNLQENVEINQTPVERSSNIPVAYAGDSVYNSNKKSETPEDSIGESLKLDEAALQILCGNKKKRQHMPVNIIDLSGEELMPDSKEWLLKQFTEEKKGSGLGHKKSIGFSAQSKRKHQITYLAYQAKEQEQELQNMWAQNRMSRKQTQQKYGF